MTASTRPMTEDQVRELRTYVAWAPMMFRMALFTGAVVFVAWLLRAINAVIARRLDLSSHAVWWVVPAALFAAALYRSSAKWTGGASFRAKVRADLADRVVSVESVSAVDAIEIEEREDEGPGFFLKTDDGKTLLFAGQYLEGYRRKGFPWKRFELVETPRSKVFLDIRPSGEKLEPSSRRPALAWDDVKRFGMVNANYVIVGDEFESLRRS